jgi:hypothetical protein
MKNIVRLRTKFKINIWPRFKKKNLALVLVYLLEEPRQLS